MSYTIIGSDAQHYGPIGEEELRRWIAEGRLNAQSMAKTESDAAFRPLSTFSEFAEAFAPPTPAPGAPPGLAMPPALAEGDYDLGITLCISRAWDLVKNNFWPAVGVTLLVMAVIFAFSQVTSLLTRPTMDEMIRLHHISLNGVFIIGWTSILGAPVYTVLMAGLYEYFLKLIRAECPTVRDAFSGFGPSLGQLVFLGLVQGIVVLLGYALCFIPGLYLNVAWFFAMPLVIDKRMDCWSALELSRKTVNKHWFVVFGFLIVYGLLAMSGVIACCLGIFVTMPIGIAALMYGYERVFSPE
jgi:hypothetical protein